MAKFELKLPKMGESVAEATINSWLKEIGDKVEVDESVIEISTDKVDSDVPSEVSGILIEKKFYVNDVVEVGETFAIIETDSNIADSSIEVSIDEKSYDDEKSENFDLTSINPHANDYFDQAMSLTSLDSQINDTKINRFYSPLVKNIAKKEKTLQGEKHVFFIRARKTLPFLFTPRENPFDEANPPPGESSPPGLSLTVR